MSARSPALSLPAILFGGVAVTIVAVFVGLVAASGFLVGQMLLAGLLVGAGLLLFPLQPLVVVLLAITFLLQGTATYFLRFPQAAWLPYLLAILLSLKLLGFANQSSLAADRRVRQDRIWNSPPLLLLFLYFICTVSAIVINRPPMFQVVVGLKNALPIWIVAALFYQGARIEGFLDRIWRLLKLIFFLQLPVVLYQRLIIVPTRHDLSSSADAVVGTFGGLIDAGGANSTLVLFCLLVMAYQLALWSRGQAGIGATLLVWLVGLVIILSGEVKAAFIWIPLVIVYILRGRILASFGAAVGAIGIAIALVFAMVSAYSLMYWQGWQNTSSRTNVELIDRMSYFFDTSNINYRTGEISRGASVALWFEDGRTDVAHRIVGFGPGASRISATGGLGEVAWRFAPLSVSATSVSLLLWDSGLLGLLAFVGVVGSIAWSLLRIAKLDSLPVRQRCQAEAMAVLMLMFVSLLAYNRTLNDEPSIQVLLAMCLGCALHWQREAASVDRMRRRPVMRT